jgi:hypothetical protein
MRRALEQDAVKLGKVGAGAIESQDTMQVQQRLVNQQRYDSDMRRTHQRWAWASQSEQRRKRVGLVIKGEKMGCRSAVPPYPAF